MKTKLTLLLLVVTICVNKPNITQAQVNVQDSLALVDLYNSTDGPNWYNNSGWLTGPIENWFGIGLNGDRVNSVALGGNNLKGGIACIAG